VEEDEEDDVLDEEEDEDDEEDEEEDEDIGVYWKRKERLRGKEQDEKANKPQSREDKQ
jgi:hypothetical protein